MSMRPPEFDDLVGTDLDPAERQRLLRVHELLVAAGPPPDFEPATAPPRVATVVATGRFRIRGRRLALVALASSFAIAVFGAGYLVGDRSPGPERVLAMAGTGNAPDASASLEIFAKDDAGNWPMELEVKGLKPAPSGRAYEVWLTKDGKLAAFCGSFRAEPDGTTKVPMNAPYRLLDFDSWVVVEEGSKAPLLET